MVAKSVTVPTHNTASVHAVECKLIYHHSHAVGLTSANGHSTQVEYQKNAYRLAVSRTHQKFHHEFSVFECMMIAQNLHKKSVL